MKAWFRIPAAVITIAVTLALASCMDAQLTPEYIEVQFEPEKPFRHAGQCPTRNQLGEPLTPGDVSVIVDEVCLGFVGELIQVSRGVFEVSVDVAGSEMVVLAIKDTTPNNPKVILIEIAPGGG